MKNLSKLISQSVYCILSASMVRQIQPNKADLDISTPDCELKSNMLFLYKSPQRRNKQRWENSEMYKPQFSYSPSPITISGETIDVKSGLKWGMDCIYAIYIMVLIKHAILQSWLIFAFWFAFSLYFQMSIIYLNFLSRHLLGINKGKKKKNPKSIWVGYLIWVKLDPVPCQLGKGKP